MARPSGFVLNICSVSGRSKNIENIDSQSGHIYWSGVNVIKLFMAVIYDFT